MERKAEMVSAGHMAEDMVEEVVVTVVLGAPVVETGRITLAEVEEAMARTTMDADKVAH